jgi:formylglycine-generating enzyme required for sulfatase activity
MNKLSSTGFILFFILNLALVLTGCEEGPQPLSFSIAESFVPGAASFPTGIDDSGQACTTVNYPYYMAKYEVTYSLWKEVYDWAQTNGYVFSNPGNCGGGFNMAPYALITDTGNVSDPVTGISWYDAVVWCNALTEYYNERNTKNLECVYKDFADNVIRNSIDDTSLAYMIFNMHDFDRSANGFRLPTSMEWELAARYRGGDSTNTVSGYSNPYFTTGNSASGATGAYTDEDATNAVAWYFYNSQIPPVITTHPVGQKLANTLGIYDMSGNVSEWCFDISDLYGVPFRVRREGNFTSNASGLQVGIVSCGSGFDYPPNPGDLDIGFRTVRTE